MNIKVHQMEGKNGPVKNQFIIQSPEGKYFQSYSSIIAHIDNEGNVTLDSHYWDYSVTTGKYRNIFLSENKAKTQKKIDDGTYKLTNLN